MIDIESLPVKAQKNYKFTNMLRKIAMFAGWGIAVLLFIYTTITQQGTFLENLVGSIMTGGILLGIIHCEFLMKKLSRAMGVLGIFINLFIVGFTFFFGWIFLIIDTVLFIMKKPLVYPMEHKNFLMDKAVQREMEEEYYNAVMNDTKNIEKANKEDAAMETLQKLKEMLDQGIITEEEFNIKKKDLLEKF